MLNKLYDNMRKMRFIFLNFKNLLLFFECVFVFGVFLLFGGWLLYIVYDWRSGDF